MNTFLIRALVSGVASIGVMVLVVEFIPLAYNVESYIGPLILMLIIGLSNALIRPGLLLFSKQFRQTRKMNYLAVGACSFLINIFFLQLGNLLFKKFAVEGPLAIIILGLLLVGPAVLTNASIIKRADRIIKTKYDGV